MYEPGGTGLTRPSCRRCRRRVEQRPLAAMPAGRRAGSCARRSNSTSGKIAFSDTRMPLPTAVPRCSWKRSIAATTSSRLRVGGCTSERGAGERHDADAGRAAAGSSTKALRRVLGGGEPVRLDVGRAHAARDVHRQDHRLVLRRQRDHGRGPRDRDDHRDQREQEQHRRHVAPQLGPAPIASLDHAPGSRSWSADFFRRRSSKT